MTKKLSDFGLMSIKEFSMSIGKPESTVRTWKKRKVIPLECFLTIGSSVFIKIETFKQCFQLDSFSKEVL